MRETRAGRAIATVVVATGLVLATRGCAFELPDLVVRQDAGQGGGGATSVTTSTAAGGTGGVTTTSSTTSSTTPPPPPCGGANQACSADGQCCDGMICPAPAAGGPGTPSTCCAPTGAVVAYPTCLSACCSHNCDKTGTCACNGAGAGCTRNVECCAGTCTGGRCCTAVGNPCSDPSECCSGCCFGVCYDSGFCNGG